MRTRFILALDDDVTADINKAIGELIKTEGSGWWHWYQHTWLIADPKGRKVSWWMDKLKALTPQPGFLIFDADTGEWSGFTNTKHFEWINKNWKPKD
jgi:hypothetical protein